MIRYDAELRQVWVLGRRLHHGMAGAVLALAGLLLMWDDRRDAPWSPARLPATGDDTSRRIPRAV
jgi:hypothetical protein